GTTTAYNHDRATTRNTIQRPLVLEAVRTVRDHPTSADGYEAVRRHHPSISRATGYRNLGVLTSRGEVSRAEAANGAGRHDFRTPPHCHALCRTCGGVFDIEMPQVDMASQVPDAHGFSLERCEIVFEGVCAQCRSRDEAHVEKDCGSRHSA